MTQDRTTTLFFEIFSSDMPRQGPGDASSTRQALALAAGSHITRVLDVGCGTGPQTVVLAQHLPDAHITAIDTHQPFIDVLRRRVDASGIADRVEARVGDMRRLDFAPGSFDLIWCEGAIYIMGFEAALRDWRRLLAPGGHIVASEVCWTKPNPPDECLSFWAREYPAIRDVPALLTAIDACGYETAGHFILPPSSWWEDFYRPLQQSVRRFRERHGGESDAHEVADQVELEIDLWRRHSDFYNYAFFVMRTR